MNMSVLNANECNEVLLVTVFYGVSKEKQRKKKVNGSQEASNGVLNPFFPSFTYKSHFARLSVGVCVCVTFQLSVCVTFSAFCVSESVSLLIISNVMLDTEVSVILDLIS